MTAPAGGQSGRLPVALALGVVALAVGTTCVTHWSHGGHDTVRAQVALFWGGGADRSWDGEFRIQTDSPGARIEWIRVTDFESGDRFLAGSGVPEHKQAVPPGWRAADPADFGEPSAPPANGARLQTDTQGEADGLCFSLRGDPRAVIELDFGGQAVLHTTLETLLEGPVVVPADDSGNVLLAQAVDLRGHAAPSVPHLDQPARRVSLHTHSAFSSNPVPLEPLAKSLRPFVPTVWWTNHNIAEQRLIIAGDFEDTELVARHWQSRVSGASITRAGLDADAAAGEHGYRIEAMGREQPTGRAWIRPPEGSWPTLFTIAYGMQPVLRWSWKPLTASDGSASIAFIMLQHVSGRTLRYLSGSTESFDPAVDIVLDAPVNEWQSVERNVADDARRLFGEIDGYAFSRVSFGVLTTERITAGALFDELELELPGPAERIQTLREAFSRVDSVRSRLGVEQSAWIAPDGFGFLEPHFTALAPEITPDLFDDFDRPPTAEERRAFVRRIQAAGGCVGTHHMQRDEHHDAFLDGAGFGIDLFEIGAAWITVPAYETADERRDRDAHGYPQVFWDEVHPLLVRWDRMTARGLLLTGYGAPDLNERFDRPGQFMNRWLTWILSEEDTPTSQLRALRSGQASAGDWQSQAVLSLSVDAQPWMGKLVATDRERHVVRAHVTGAIPGSRLRWIRGPLVREHALSKLGPPAAVRSIVENRRDEADFTESLELDTRLGVFVRAELLNPAGQLVALSNPVVFTPYWPTRWSPGRVAFDWQGCSLAGSRGVVLDTASVADDGSLQLSGTAGDRGGQLTLRALDIARVHGSGGWTLRQDESNEELRLEDIPAGPFSVSVVFDTPWEPVPSADPLAIPQRKQLVLAIDVGVPESEQDRQMQGFGKATRGAIGFQDKQRAVLERGASFQLPVPTGERSWLRLARYGNSARSGQILMDGVPIGSFEPMSDLIFAIEPTEPGADASQQRVFTIVLDPPGGDTLRLNTIQLWRGAGVVEY